MEFSKDNDIFASDDEDNLKYDPDDNDGSPGERKKFDKLSLHCTFGEFSPNPEGIRDSEDNKLADDGSNSSGEEEIERRDENKRFYEFNFDYPYPESKEEFTHVRDPIKAGHISYTVSGEDDEGPFEGFKRYRDFFSLRQYLVARWPGVLIPPIPPKQSVGNKKDKFVENRMYFLDRFMKKILEVEYLKNSKEFKLFSRSTSGEIAKMLSLMPKITPTKIKERLENEVGIDPNIDEFTAKECRTEVNDFGSFLKKIMVTLKLIKENSERMVPVKESCNKRTRVIVNVMSSYEQDGLHKFTDGTVSSNLNEIKDKCEGMTYRLTNTFKDFYYWIRGEMGDVESILDAINGKDKTFQVKLKLENKRKNCQNELDDLTAGKKGIKNLFKSNSGIESRKNLLTVSIKQIDEDIEILEQVIKMMDWNISKNIIPMFKKRQVENYYGFLKYISKREVNNSAAQSSFWSDFLKNQNANVAES